MKQGQETFWLNTLHLAMPGCEKQLAPIRGVDLERPEKLTLTDTS
jgi:hypothetical protein